MAEKKASIRQQLKQRLAVDSVDGNDDKLYKDLARGPGPQGGKDYRKPKDTKGTLIRMLGYAGKKKIYLFFIVFLNNSPAPLLK